MPLGFVDAFVFRLKFLFPQFLVAGFERAKIEIADPALRAMKDYAIAVSPGLTLMQPKPLVQSETHILACGLTDSVDGFEPLPFVADEIHDLAERFDSQTIVNQQFNLDNLEKQLQSKSITILHIASHGQFGGEADNSFILTHEGKLHLDKLAAMLKPRRYSDNPIELLTLSACQTAAGNDRAALGLAGVAIQAGARSALASLWFVNDQASSQLISEFYDKLLNASPLTKAHALRAAQLSIFNDSRYRHPCYWAPYIIIGNWE